MEAVEVARTLIVQIENISVFKVTYRRPDGSTYEIVTSVISPLTAKVRDEAEMFNVDC